MKKVVVILGLIVVLLLGLVVHASRDLERYSEKVQSIAKYFEVGQNDKAMDVYNSLSDNEKNEFVDFLEEYPDKLPPLFFITTADHVYKTDKDKAVFFYFLGKLRAAEDVVLCKDTTAASQLGVYPMLAQNTLRYVASKIEDGDYSIDFMQKTLDWDDSHPKRFNSKWACYHGIEAFSHDPELIDEKDFNKKRNEVRAQVQEAIDRRRNREQYKK